MLAFATFAAFFTMPFFLLRIALKYNRLKEDQEYRKKYKKFFDGFNIESKLSLNYPNFYLIRRYLATSLLVFLWDRKFALI